ncbi:MAG: ABC transporter ATP-binding protein [Propionibacteriaceae bacterium]|jgi:putative ABC transport system ATP-binding protein|nr:ABC transporter ATP-binding protein [Propionibacteriaceae bacterium]
MALLELRNVTRSYGELDALKNVDLSVEEGEWLSIMGPSGSGKTTMMNLIGCLDKPTSGEIWLDGTELSHLSGKALTKVRRNTIGLIFQKFHLVGHLTALENVMLAQYYHSLPDKQEALEALDRVGLAARASHLPSQLSGGEQQRVCIARALINYPKIVLADEPTGNLDEANEAVVLDFFSQLHAQGTTLIVVTHDPEVGRLGERQVNLAHGVIEKEVRHALACPLLPDQECATPEEPCDIRDLEKVMA